jgi:hypothetical protein
MCRKISIVRLSTRSSAFDRRRVGWSLNDQLAIHAMVPQTTKDDARKLEFTLSVCQEADDDRLTLRQFRSNSKWLEFESVRPVRRRDAELNYLTLPYANLRWFENKLAGAHRERDIGRSIRGIHREEPRILDAAAQHHGAACEEHKPTG